jgi:hypothetical protein
MREFLVYGFKSREAVGRKSARSYDNERRRIESWLSDYMSFHQDTLGKNVFISVDSRKVPHNPLYKAWKAASFTKNDINLHFILLDLLFDGCSKTIPQIMTALDADYSSFFSNKAPIEESTLRKKLKEYEELGLICSEKQKKCRQYRLPQAKVELKSWWDAITFFSEGSPLGVIGSFLLDKLKQAPDLFIYKHHYFLFTLDDKIMLDILTAMRQCCQIEIELLGRKEKLIQRVIFIPIKIFISTQGGRQYLAGFRTVKNKLWFYRLDRIQTVKLLSVQADYEKYQRSFAEKQQHLWGVATEHASATLEHVEMKIHIAPDESYLIERLEREKRCGTICQINETTWQFTADVYNAREMLPWLRTFIGRIVSLKCSNQIVEQQFWADINALYELYGGINDVIS